MQADNVPTSTRWNGRKRQLREERAKYSLRRYRMRAQVAESIAVFWSVCAIYCLFLFCIAGVWGLQRISSRRIGRGHPALPWRKYFTTEN